MQRNSLRSNFISLGLVQAINFLVPLFIMPYVISIIGAAAFGALTVAQVTMVYVNTVVDYGFGLTASRDIALNRHDADSVKKIFYRVLSVKLLLTVILFIVLSITIWLVPFFRMQYQLYLFAFSTVAGQALMVSWLFQGAEKMKYITISMLVSRIVFVVLVLVLVRHQDDGPLFLLSLGVGNMVAGLASLCIAFRLFHLLPVRLPSRMELRDEFHQGWQVTASNLAINTYLYSGVFILRLFTNDLITGYYSIAERILYAVRQLLSVFAQAVYPHICSITRTGPDAMRRFTRRVFLPFLLAVAIGCSICLVFAGTMVHLFYKGPSSQPATLLKLFAFVPLIICANIPAYQLLVAFNHKKSYLAILAGGTVVNITLNCLLSRSFGATGTAISVVVTELFITLMLNRSLFVHGMFDYLLLFRGGLAIKPGTDVRPAKGLN